MYHQLIFPASILLLITICGCTPSTPFRMEFVEGTVTLDGKPEAGVVVNFSAAEPGSGVPAYGETDANGRYILTATQGGVFGKGTKAGTYAVSFIKDVPERAPTPQELHLLDTKAIMYTIPLVSIVPKAYNDPAASDFKVEIVRGKNRFDFELKSDR